MTLASDEKSPLLSLHHAALDGDSETLVHSETGTEQIVMWLVQLALAGSLGSEPGSGLPVSLSHA